MYNAEISRGNPACLFILLDQSGSMSGRWADTAVAKSEQVALAVNRILANAVLLCSKGDDRIYDYFEVGILGYGDTVSYALHGSSPTRPLIPVSDLVHNPRRVDQLRRRVPDGAGGLVEATINSPVWVDPVHNGGTPMVAALQTATDAVAGWCEHHQGSYPPLVVNITDGEATDGVPLTAAATLRRTGTRDGDTLLFNLHVSALTRQAVIFPETDRDLPDAYAEQLFAMSSQLPLALRAAARGQGHQLGDEARGFLYNADATTVIEFLDLGTRAVTPTGLRELTAGSEPAG